MANRYNTNMTDQSSKRLLVGTNARPWLLDQPTPSQAQKAAAPVSATKNTVTGIPFATEQDYLNSLNVKPPKMMAGAFLKDKLRSMYGDTGNASSRVMLKDDDVPTAYGDMGGAGSFAPSQTYQQAMAYTQQLLDKLSSGRTSYTDKINSLMAQISGRDPFSYDANTDPMFQSYLQMMMGSGQQAMEDTVGQAAGLTGGYGSSYATTAGNQAYNQMVQGAYNNLPDYYNAALSAYEAEGNRLAGQLGMYQTADDMEYNRLANAYSAQMQNAAQIYDREYNAYANDQRQKQWEQEYSLKAAQDAMKASASTGGSSTGGGFKAIDSTAEKRIQQYASKYGADSDEVANYVLQLANQFGYSPSDMWAIVQSAKGPSYAYNHVNGRYEDEYGNAETDNGAYTAPQLKVSGADKNGKPMYQDQHGNTYTKADVDKLKWKKYIIG